MSAPDTFGFLFEDAQWPYIQHAFSAGANTISEAHCLVAMVAAQMSNVLKAAGSAFRTSLNVPHTGRDVKLRIAHTRFSTAIPLMLGGGAVTIKSNANGDLMIPVSDPAGTLRLIHAFGNEVVSYAKRLKL